MPEYGNYEEKIRTLGELRKFINETLKGLEDEYTFSIDDDWTGVDITLCANCDVSYSEREFYWTTSSHWYSDLGEVVAKKEELKRKARAFDIVKKKHINIYGFQRHFNSLGEKFTYNYYLSNYTYYHYGDVRWGIDTLSQEEFDLLKEMTKNG